MVTEFAISLLRITLSFFFFSLRTFDSFWYDKQRHKSAYDTNPLERFFTSTSSRLPLKYLLYLIFPTSLAGKFLRPLLT